MTVPDGYPKGDAAFTNNKVIVARSYVDRLVAGDDTPDYDRPDDTSPRDHSGHGTAVAMIAAGATNTGLLATITGIAPKAWIGSYKVFGTPGVNDLCRPRDSAGAGRRVCRRHGRGGAALRRATCISGAHVS